MSAIDHAERAHAKLSASGSKRWMTCTPSAKLEEKFPDSSSPFAAEGTLAHELAEKMLRKEAFKVSDYPVEMVKYIHGYKEFVEERINYHGPTATVLFEERLNFSNWVPDGFGTGDVVIISDFALEVIDLKYGKGVSVSSEDNSQLKLYALGAYEKFEMLYDYNKVILNIYQPRIDNISIWETTLEELLSWGNWEVRPLAKKAMDGEGELVAGDHCRFCKARHTCKTLANYNLELAKYEFEDAAFLSKEDIAHILTRVDPLVKWAQGIKDWALSQAENHGMKFPGYKLVEGRAGNRKFQDEELVEKRLIEMGYKEDEIYEPRSMLGVSGLEKVLGRKQFGELLADQVIRTPAKPTLVPEDDKRPELNSKHSAVSDFN